MEWKNLRLLFLIVNISICCSVNILINANGSSTKLRQFWRNTGFCPPDPKENIPNFLLSEDVRLNLALIGSLPNLGITHVRIHWMLNMISLNSNGSLDFSNMDLLLDYLTSYDLKPNFELMGFPLGTNTSGTYLKTEKYWFNLTEKLTKRYTNRYGISKLSKWRFETWNEPDLKVYNILNFTLSDYLQYVYGCARGVRSAFQWSKSDVNGNFGGPAGLFRDKGHPLCWGLLATCNSYSKSQCPLQYISFHRKGDATSQTVLNGTLELLDLIQNRFPSLRQIPIANDESDILTNWSKSLEWRADVRYAAMIVKVISEYYKSVQLKRKLKIKVLSNDNAFVNYHPFYFTQRTLFARFQMNNTKPPHNQFIKKPVYAVMGLLSFLDDEYLESVITPLDPLLTVIATRSRKHKLDVTSVLISYANDTEENIENITQLSVVLQNLSNDCCKYVIYSLDNIYTNPYRLWQKFQAPVFPAKHIRKQLRNVEEPFYIKKHGAVNNSEIVVNLNATIPSLYLLNVCCKSQWFPAKVFTVRITNITYNEILITWKYRGINKKCIKTYEVMHIPVCTLNPIYRVNLNDTIFLSYHHAPTDIPFCENTKGIYYVKAVDYWDRSGENSDAAVY